MSNSFLTGNIWLANSSGLYFGISQETLETIVTVSLLPHKIGVDNKQLDSCTYSIDGYYTLMGRAAHAARASCAQYSD